MKKKEYQEISDFFMDYTGAFATRGKDPEPFQLKIVHTDRVCENAEILSKKKWGREAIVYMVLAAARLHDIGRFIQYETYNTFSDAKSENHALLGVKVINKEQILNRIEEKERKLILQSVAFHNAYCLPRGLSEESAGLVKLIRDADKIDIFRVMAELYLGESSSETSFITHFLPDDGKVRASLIQDILDKRLIDMRHVKTLNDMKLLQISWLFDLNYPASMALVRERGNIYDILSTMPECREVEQVRKTVEKIFESPLGGV